jgi:hypothetical protein
MGEQARSYGSGGGSERVYVVEARSTYSAPQTHQGYVLDNRWRRIDFQESPIGVANRVFTAEAQRHGFLTYAAAMALLHWFLAPGPDWRDGTECIEARLVEIELTHSFSTKEIGVGPTLSAFQGRRDFQAQPRDDSA